jgi:hypothetical protein
MEIAKTELKAVEKVVEHVYEIQMSQLEELRLTMSSGGLAETIL